MKDDWQVPLGIWLIFFGLLFGLVAFAYIFEFVWAGKF